MTSAPPAFDLVLGYPQWQGSSRPEHMPRGARATAEVCARFGPFAGVPLAEATGDAQGIRRWDAVFAQYLSARELLAQHRPKRLLTAGGDCSVDVAAIEWLASVYPDLTVIWVDAHLDSNAPETSASRAFHGMPVRAILGEAPAPMRSLLGAPITPERFRYVGIRVGDDAEWDFQRAHALRTLAPGEHIAGPVHIHFDLDVLEPTEFPWLAYREPDGLAVADAVALVERIAREAELVGFTVTEFAPEDDAGARAGGEVIARLCAAALAPNRNG